MNDVPNITQAVPLLVVADMTASHRFYVDGLGFEITQRWEVDGKTRWCRLEIGQAALMLEGKQPDDPRRKSGEVGKGVTIFYECQDALKVYREAKERGLMVERPFVGNGMWVTGLNDPDGYRIEFASRTDEDEGTRYKD